MTATPDPSSSRPPFRVSHVLIDIEGTLVEYGNALPAAATATATELTRRLGHTVDPQELLALRAEFMRDREWGNRPSGDQRHEALRRLLVAHNAPPSEMSEAAIQSLMRIYEAARDAAVTPYPDVHEAVEALAAMGVTLVAASNGDVDLARAGIAHIEATHYASHLGVAKPDPRFFALASERFGIAPEQMLMVGDRLDNDYSPARAAGMHAVLLDREDRVHNPEVIRITSLRDLPALVERF